MYILVQLFILALSKCFYSRFFSSETSIALYKWPVISFLNTFKGWSFVYSARTLSRWSGCGARIEAQYNLKIRLERNLVVWVHILSELIFRHGLVAPEGDISALLRDLEELGRTPQHCQVCLLWDMAYVCNCTGHLITVIVQATCVLLLVVNTSIWKSHVLGSVADLGDKVELIWFYS